MTEYEPGQRVEWTIRGGEPPFGRRPSGEILETGVSKFGHDDIIIVDCPTDPADETYIQPADVERVL